MNGKWSYRIARGWLSLCIAGLILALGRVAWEAAVVAVVFFGGNPMAALVVLALAMTLWSAWRISE